MDHSNKLLRNLDRISLYVFSSLFSIFFFLNLALFKYLSNSFLAFRSEA